MFKAVLRNLRNVGAKPVITDKEKVDNVLTKSVEEVFIRESLEKKLLSGRVLRVKFGVDPTSPNIHLGRAVVLRKLRDFQKLGHKIVFIVGDFTAQIGDPSDKLSKRPMLSAAEVKKNLKGYLAQAGKIIDLGATEIHYNASWLGKLGFQEIGELAEAFTVQQMSARRNFSDRFEKGEEVSLREFLYPLMQGYDSVVVNSDVEIGGTDQLFNMKAGRIVQKHYGKKEQDVMTTSMLEGTDGRKMSSSWGNVINILDTPKDMYGKLMSVRDDLIEKYTLLCTDLTPASAETHPKEAKMRLAHEVVKIYHGKKSADEAEKSFVDTFSKGEVPTDIQEIKVTTGEKIGDVLVHAKIISSKSDWARLIKEGAITILETDQKITDIHAVAEKTATIRVGKKRFVKIVLK